MKRFVIHGAILLYLTASLSGWLFTVLRTQLPFVPVWATSYTYQMMAPYQGFNKVHQDFYARGQRADLSWEPINLRQYFPYDRAQRMARSGLLSFYLFFNEEDRSKRYQQLASSIRIAEQKKGNNYIKLEFGVQKWPISKNGYSFNRTAENSTYPITVIVP